MNCLSCHGNNSAPGSLPPRESIFDNGLWRVAHAINCALPGWIVVIPKRHILSLSELTPEEATILGPLLASLSKALEATFKVPKAYVVFLAEKPGFEHAHLHVIPRPVDLPEGQRGPGIFDYLKQPHEQWVGEAEMNHIADRLRPLLLNNQL